MEYRTLGRSDIKVSTIGLGCNNFGGRIGMDQSRQVIWKALDLGVTLFDTAPSYGDEYGSEIALGQFLGKQRKDVVLSTKFGADRKGDDVINTGSGRADIVRDVDSSLKRLKTDWIDVFHQHRRDPNTPLEETLEALAELIKAGKIRCAGISAPEIGHIEESVAIAERRDLPGFAACMGEYHLLDRGLEADVLPAAARQGMGFLPFFPLAGGLLTGKYRKDAALPEGARLTKMQGLAKRFLTTENFDKTEKLIAFARQRGVTLVSVAVSWLLARDPVASVIAGATTTDQVVANVKSGEFLFVGSDLDAIDEITA